MKKFLIKTIFVTVGCCINIFGLSLAIRAGFGASTFTVMLDGVSRTLGITMGQASWLVNVAILLFCVFYSRSQIHVGTLIVILLTGLLLDFYAGILVYPESRMLCFLLLLLGVCIMAFGASVTAFADFGRGAYEALTFAFVDHNGWQVRVVRITLDVLLVAVGMLLGGKAGLCTLCTIPLCGPVMQVSLKLLRKVFPKLAPPAPAAKAK